MNASRLLTADRLARLIALVTFATLAIHYDVAVFLIDFAATATHSEMLVFIALTYLGFGIQAVIGLCIGRAWGNWGYYRHVLTGTDPFQLFGAALQPRFRKRLSVLRLVSRR